MFATFTRCLLCLTFLIRYSLSIPFSLNDFDAQGVSFDDGSYSPETLPGPSPEIPPVIPPETGFNDANLFASLPNEPVENLPSDFNNLNLPDYSPSGNQDWTSYLAPDPLLPSNNDILISDAGASCPLGKREDGASCAPQLPKLQVPNLLENFMTISGGDNQQAGESGTGADALTGSLSAPDPCLLGYYHLHVCCEGPVGVPIGIAFNWIENCQLGT